MNRHLLHKEIQDFINANLTADINKLILKGSPFKEVSIQEIAEQIVSKNKSKTKLSTWFNTKDIYYPNKLNIEQTSSEITANYKASLISGEKIVDITGGFGVDCVAFSKTFKRIFHCEINSELSEIVAYNLKCLPIQNVKTIQGNGLDFVLNNKQTYDVIYVDPSRRDDVKKRVFLLEDCSPNLPLNLEKLFNFSNIILVKTAPLLDINAAVKELNFVKEIHIVSVNNDVKEVLYLLEKDYKDKPKFTTINFLKTIIEKFEFTLATTEPSYTLPKKYLYEPNAAIMKSGAFIEVSILFKIEKLHRHSHLYTSDKIVENFPGRRFSIIDSIPYNLKQLKVIKIKKANITTRNFPESVSKIRQKTKIKDGGALYLFFTTNLKGEKIVLICKKV